MLFLLVLWIIVIFIGTCTKDVNALFTSGEVSFSFSLNPDKLDLFYLYPLSKVSEIEIVGHFLMFFTLAMFLGEVFRSKIVSVVLAVAYGVIIELIQPFFGRGGDYYDLLADVIGIVAWVVIYLIFNRRVRLTKVKDDNVMHG